MNNKYIFLKTLRELLLSPKGVLIEMPNKIIPTGFRISNAVLSITHVVDDQAYFTRKSLKHLIDKGILIDIFLNQTRLTLSEPDEIRKGKVKNRFIVSKKFLLGGSNRYHIVILEIRPEHGHLIVTIFTGKQKYLSNFNLLWRTAVLS